jgi:serine/threonine protein kinase
MSLDNYEILKELGRGGMGAVFLANDKRLKRQVAIKVLQMPQGIDFYSAKNAVNNFKREAVAIANLSHNNIVNIYDIGEKGNVHYIVMELIDGQPLSKILKAQGQPFHLETVLQISSEICDALSYIHRNNVIHRDIKPENIIYTAKGISKLTDFGIAKFKGDQDMETESKPGDVKGTILYISPEQLQTPDLVDGRADMYSFAVSLYELLTGTTPFHGETPREVIMKILTQEPIAPSKLVPDLLPHIDSVILKALAKDPDKRYENVQEFNDEIKNIADFRSKFSIQGGLKSGKKDKVFYSQTSLDSFEDVLVQGLKFPPDAQQRMLYEIEILFSKYFEEYDDYFKNNNTTTKYSDDSSYYSNYNDDYSNDDNYQTTSVFLKSLAYICPKLTNEGQNILKSPNLTSLGVEGSILLSKITSDISLENIYKKFYSPDKLMILFNYLYLLSQKNLISFDSIGFFNETIFLGDMLTEFKVISKQQLDQALIVKSRSKDKLIGEILVSNGFLSRESLLNILKIQSWYRKFLRE